MGKRILVLLLTAALLTGCGAKKDPEGLRVIYKITVTCHDGGSSTQQIYTTQPKIRLILNGIRTLGQQFSPAIDPETLSERTFHIDISFTDGTNRLYQTKGDRYIRTDQERWKQTDPKQLEKLNHLLLTLPGDRITPSDVSYQRGCVLIEREKIGYYKLRHSAGKQS